MPSLSLSKWWGSGGLTTKFRYGMSPQFKSGRAILVRNVANVKRLEGSRLGRSSFREADPPGGQGSAGVFRGKWAGTDARQSVAMRAE